MKRLMHDSHMHTPLCGHAEGQPEEYAEAALQKNLAGITFSCHAPFIGRSCEHAMQLAELEKYKSMLASAKESFAERLSILTGLEFDYYPGIEHSILSIQDMISLDYSLGSVHPHEPIYYDTYWSGSYAEFVETYFYHLAMAAESELFDCLAHPDIVKVLEPREWSFQNFQEVIVQSLNRIAETGVALELNTSGLSRSLPEMNPGIEMLALMAERKIPVVLGSDAHEPSSVAQKFPTALGRLQDAGYKTIRYFEGRRPVDILIEKAQASLKASARSV